MRLDEEQVEQRREKAERAYHAIAEENSRLRDELAAMANSKSKWIKANIFDREAWQKDRSELRKLRAELVLVIEDRARFPDKPDMIGNMISAHYMNLKSKAQACEETALSHMARSQKYAGALREIEQLPEHRRRGLFLAHCIARKALGI